MQIERVRGELKVVARPLLPQGEEGRCRTTIEATFSGGPEGMSLRLMDDKRTRVFTRSTLARHPALQGTLRLIADEVDSGAPDSTRVLDFLFQSLKIYADRLRMPAAVSSSVPSVRDPRIEKAVELLNTDIARRWTVEHLASAVGLSRPVFAREFLRVLGLSPMRYLRTRRMQIAARLLLTSDQTLIEVATHVGYASEFAFSRSFKRYHGVAPGQYRRTPTRLQIVNRAA